MSTTIDITATTAITPTPSDPTAAQQLRTTTAAVRVGFTWLGTRKTLTRDQKAQAARPFGAEGDLLSAGKKILDTKDSHLKKVSAVRGRVSLYVRSVSLPFPEPGIRLIRQDQVEPFTEQLNHFQADLQEAVEELDAAYSELREDARERLGGTL